MLMKARDDGGKLGTPPDAAAQPSGPGPSKMEREGQRPTQPVYQIQNRGMGASASSSAVDRELSKQTLMHSIRLNYPGKQKVNLESFRVTFSHGWSV